VRARNADNAVASNVTARADIESFQDPARYGKNRATYKNALAQVEAWAAIDPLGARAVLGVISRRAKKKLAPGDAEPITKRGAELHWAIREQCELAELKQTTRSLDELVNIPGELEGAVDEDGAALTWSTVVHRAKSALNTVERMDDKPAELKSELEGLFLTAVPRMVDDLAATMNGLMAGDLDEAARSRLDNHEHWLAPLAFGWGRCETDFMRAIIERTDASHPELNATVREKLGDARLLCLRASESLRRGVKTPLSVDDRASQLNLPKDVDPTVMRAIMDNVQAALTAGDGAFANRLIRAGRKPLGGYDAIKSTLGLLGDSVEAGKVDDLIAKYLPKMSRDEADAILEAFTALEKRADTAELAQSLELLQADGLSYPYNAQSRASSLLERFGDVATKAQKAEFTLITERAEVRKEAKGIAELEATHAAVRDAATIDDVDIRDATRQVENARGRAGRTVETELRPELRAELKASFAKLGELATDTEVELGELAQRSVPAYRDLVAERPDTLRAALRLNPRWGRRLLELSKLAPEVADQLPPIEAQRHALVLDRLNTAIKGALADGSEGALRSMKRDVEFYSYLIKDSEKPVPAKFSADVLAAADVDAAALSMAEIKLTALTRQLDARIATLPNEDA